MEKKKKKEVEAVKPETRADAVWAPREQCQKVFGITKPTWANSYAGVVPWRMAGQAKVYDMTFLRTYWLDRYLKDRKNFAEIRKAQPAFAAADAKQERYIDGQRQEQIALSQLKRAQLERRLVDVAVIRLCLDVVGNILKSMAESVRRHFGEEAAKMVNDAIVKMEQECEQIFEAQTRTRPDEAETDQGEGEGKPDA